MVEKKQILFGLVITVIALSFLGACSDRKGFDLYSYREDVSFRLNNVLDDGGFEVIRYYETGVGAGIPPDEVLALHEERVGKIRQDSSVIKATGTIKRKGIPMDIVFWHIDDKVGTFFIIFRPESEAAAERFGNLLKKEFAEAKVRLVNEEDAIRSNILSPAD